MSNDQPWFETQKYNPHEFLDDTQRKVRHYLFVCEVFRTSQIKGVIWNNELIFLNIF